MEEKKNEIKALINLLEDPDDEVYKIVHENLMQKGLSVIPELEQAWEKTGNQMLQSRIENVIQKIQHGNITKSLLHWVKKESHNLLKGAYLVAKLQYPELEYKKLEKIINQLIADVKSELFEDLTPLEKVKVVNHILFDVHKFSRSNINVQSAQNSYINLVLETKKGNSVTLAIIYLIIAQSIDLPVYGVNLPRNFILSYTEQEKFTQAISKMAEKNIIFYINPYNRGAVLGKKEIDFFLLQQKLKQQNSFYLPCSNLVIVQRLLINLIFAYEKLGYPNKIQELESLRDIIEKNIEKNNENRSN